jgi:hypothetical protein
MATAHNEIDEKIETVIAYSPLAVFFILITGLELFHVPKPPALAVSTFLSLICFLILASALSVRYKRPDLMRPLFPVLGLMSLTVTLIVLLIILQYYRVGDYTLRWALMLLITLIYFVFLFRAIHILQQIKRSQRAGKT